ncbi:hypothetical protein HK096_004292 [Nowakowskiella sp. JEL0078]|nr:hypothetical protein HK096_004292 [Nowakowskiella sp. JEL0078]
MVTRNLLGFLFWLKALFALSLALSILAFFSYRIVVLRKAALVGKIDFGSDLPGSSGSQGNANVAPSRCYKNDTNLARIEPPNSILFGFHLNWQIQLPLNVTTILAPYKPGIYNAFVQIDGSKATGQEYDANLVIWHGQQISLAGGGVLELTIEPISDISKLTDDLLNRIATQCRTINQQYGVPILLRYGHEMNGPWTLYGLKPLAYRAAFQRLAKIMRTKTNVTAMLWSPNVGIAYPFNSNEGIPKAGTPDFIELDTNGDGKLNGLDDPYLPYYPGDEYVDWNSQAGLSLYWYPDVTKTNIAAPPTFFQDYLTGSGPTVSTDVDAKTYNASVRNFYEVFANKRNKPIILSESGAPFIGSLANGPGELAIKRGWYLQILNQTITSQFPKLKAVVNFEEKKQDDKGSYIKDWALTHNLTVLAQLNKDLTTLKSLTVQADYMTFKCDGSITLGSTTSNHRRGIAMDL